MHLAKGAKGKGQEVGTGLGCDQVQGGLSVTSVIRWVTGGGGAEEDEGRGAALRGNEARGAAGRPRVRRSVPSLPQPRDMPSRKQVVSGCHREPGVWQGPDQPCPGIHGPGKGR